MTPEQPQFYDPTLKRALIELAGNHKATASARNRILAAMAGVRTDGPATAPSQPAISAPISPVRRMLTIAAAIIVGLGLSYYGYDWYSDWAQQRAQAKWAKQYPTTAEYPSVWQAMVALHEKDSACASTQAAMTASVNEPAALQVEAQGRIGHTIPMPKLDGGWKLNRCCYCTVADFPGVCFHFDNGSKSVTLISLPENAWSYRVSDRYNVTVDEHPIAGYVKEGGLNCVVGDLGMPMEGVQSLIDQLRSR